MSVKVQTVAISAAVMIVSFAVFQTSADQTINTSGFEFTLPVYIVAKNSYLLPASSQCRHELEKLKQGVDDRKMWSLKMLDASGEPKPGFIYGNNFWIGSKSQCYDAVNAEPPTLSPQIWEKNILYRKIEDEAAPYLVHYFSAHFLHNSSLQYQLGPEADNLIILGLCLPASCTANDVDVVLKNVFKERQLSFSNFYNTDFELSYVKDLKVDHQHLWNWRTIGVTIIIILTLSLTCVGTWYEQCIYQKQLEVQKVHIPKDKQKTADSNLTHKNDASLNIHIRNSSTLEEVLMCFSVYTNSKNFFDTSSSASTIASLHGIRFFTIIWGYIVHTALFGQPYTDNLMMSSRLMDKFSMQILRNSSYGVDTCFCLGGFLTGYLFFMRNDSIPKTSDKFQWKVFFLSVWRRYLRLTPLQIIVMGLVELSAVFFSATSEFHMLFNDAENCPKYWWRNLLYINTFFSYQELCMAWSWYPSNDMIYFVISTILLLLSNRSFRTFVAMSMTIIFMSSIYTGYLVYSLDYHLTIDDAWRTGDSLYTPPWPRINPYIAGVLAAAVLFKMKNELLHMKKKYVWLLWFANLATLFMIIFWTYWKNASLTNRVIYISISRLLWGIAIGWIIVACCTNHGGIANKILSAKLLVPFSKVMYSAALTNAAFITFVMASGESPLHVDLIPLIILAMGFFIVTIIPAFMLTVLFEIPFSRLVRLYFKEKRD